MVKMNNFLFWISGFLKAKAIRGPNGEPYLERYMLLRWGNHTFFLHRFLDSDPDRGVHDHPWDHSVSFILCGGYLEKRLVSKSGKLWMQIRRLSAGQFNVIKGDDFHQLVLEPGRPAWTIFYHGKRTKNWGFAISERGKSLDSGPFDVEYFEPFSDNSPESLWEKTAPRGALLAGRMPVDFRLKQ